MPGGLVTVSLFVYYGATSKLVLSGELVTSKFNVKLSASSAQRTPMKCIVPIPGPHMVFQVFLGITKGTYICHEVGFRNVGTQIHGNMHVYQPHKYFCDIPCQQELYWTT